MLESAKCRWKTTIFMMIAKYVWKIVVRLFFMKLQLRVSVLCHAWDGKNFLLNSMDLEELEIFQSNFQKIYWINFNVERHYVTIQNHKKILKSCCDLILSQHSSSINFITATSLQLTFNCWDIRWQHCFALSILPSYVSLLIHVHPRVTRATLKWIVNWHFKFPFLCLCSLWDACLRRRWK